MNIVLLGSLYLAAALGQAGHRVITVGTMGGHDVPLEHPVSALTLQAILKNMAFEPDAVLLADDGNLPFVPGLESLPWPLIFYSIDTYCNPWHIPFAYAFDKVLVAQKDIVPLFRDEGHDAEWFPLFCREVEKDTVTPEEWLATRDIPVVFVGTPTPKNIPGRLPFLQAFGKFVPLEMRYGEYAPWFRRARIVLNQSAVGEVNYRCFEGMGCGAAMLHDSELYGYGELFTPGLDVLPPYGWLDPMSAAKVAKFWLDRPQKLAALALRGLDTVRRLHTDDVRAAAFVEMAEKLRMEQAWEKRLADLPKRRHFLSTAYGALAAELPPELEAHRGLYIKLAQDTYGDGA